MAFGAEDLLLDSVLAQATWLHVSGGGIEVYA